MKLGLVAACGVVAALGASGASGGGLAPTVVDPVIVAPVAPATPTLNWQGAYGGVTLGYATGGEDDVGITSGATVYTPGTLEMNGGNFGLRAGYRWQRDMQGRPFVFGVELGYEGGDIKDDFTANGYEASTKVKGVLGLRAKAGVLNQAQNTLFYGIGGVARGEFDYDVTGAGGGTAMDYDDSFSASGWILGLGIERKVTDRMSVTGEWEHVNFGSTDLEDAAGNTTIATPKYNNFKLGLNFSF